MAIRKRLRMIAIQFTERITAWNKHIAGLLFRIILTNRGNAPPRISRSPARDGSPCRLPSPLPLRNQA
ncbi:hypothetical protein [Burkholderia ubonensis]|uniref:hypothetical protein n=1 Tax=Burkholderia ubonensis TaxID=101571 RepID=UPI0012FBC2F0|nr:hypothetical protein [Burkholderia ubonensis]